MTFTIKDLRKIKKEYERLKKTGKCITNNSRKCICNHTICKQVSTEEFMDLI